MQRAPRGCGGGERLPARSPGTAAHPRRLRAQGDRTAGDRKNGKVALSPAPLPVRMSPDPLPRPAEPRRARAVPDRRRAGARRRPSSAVVDRSGGRYRRAHRGGFLAGIACEDTLPQADARRASFPSEGRPHRCRAVTLSRPGGLLARGSPYSRHLPIHARARSARGRGQWSPPVSSPPTVAGQRGLGSQAPCRDRTPFSRLLGNGPRHGPAACPYTRAPALSIFR